MFFCVVFLSFFATAQPSFVTARGGHFYRDGVPFYYVGTNYWYGGLLALNEDEKMGIGRLRQELDFLQRNGITNVRVLGGAEGSGLINGVNRVGPPLQPREGVFDPQIFKGMDALLAELGKRHMTAVIYLSNNWNWSGGFLQYLRWNGLVPDAAFNEPMAWSDLGAYTSQFYNCARCVTDYTNQVRRIITHTNALTHKRYSEDPAVMAWEIANEPRPMSGAAVPSYRTFISATAALIKKLDTHHLVTTGTEGYMSTDNVDLYRDIHRASQVDYLTIHIWPKNWSWFTGADIAGGMDSVISKTIAYLAVHKKMALALNKPLVIEEFGLPRDGHSYDIDSPTTYRDRYYQLLFSQWLKSQQSNDVLAGVNFWAFGGIARPVKGQTMWKKGDPYMGDPPMEEQGLNSVFISDSSTWDLIRSVMRQSKRISGPGATGSIH